MAFEKIGLQAVLEDKDFQAGLQRYMDGTRQMESSTSKTAGVVSALGVAISGGLVIAIGAAVAALGSFFAISKAGIDTARDWAIQLDRLGDQFGLSGEQGSGWLFLMNKVGLSLDEGAMGLNFFTRGLNETTKATKDGKTELTPFGEALKKLGITAFDSRGKLKSFDVIMPEIMDKFQKLPAGVNASALAMELFGARGGSRFLDFLRQGSKGLADATKKAKEYGLVVGTETVDGIEQMGFAQNELNLQMKGIFNQIGLTLLPTMRELTAFISKEILPAFSEWAKERTPLITKTLKDFSRTMMAEVIPALRNLWEWVSKGVLPILKQLIKIFSGDFPKAQKAQVDAIKNAWRIIKPIYDAIFGQLSVLWIEIQPKVTKAWLNIQKVTKQVWDYIWKNVIRPIVTAIQAFIEEHHEEILTIINAVWKQIQGIFKTAWAIIRGIVNIALDILGGDFEEAGRDWKGMMADVMEGLKLIIGGAWGIIQTIIMGALAAILNSIKAKGSEIMTAITSPFANAVLSLLNFDWLGLGKQILTGILSGLGTLGNAVKDAILGPFAAAVYAILTTDWFGVGKTVMQLVAQGLEFVKNRVIEAIQGPLQALIDLLNNLLNSLGFTTPSSGFGAPARTLAPVSAGNQWINNFGGNTYNFNMSVATFSPQSQVVRDYGIMKALVGG